MKQLSMHLLYIYNNGSCEKRITCDCLWYVISSAQCGGYGGAGAWWSIYLSSLPPPPPRLPQLDSVHGKTHAFMSHCIGKSLSKRRVTPSHSERVMRCSLLNIVVCIVHAIRYSRICTKKYTQLHSYNKQLRTVCLESTEVYICLNSI